MPAFFRSHWKPLPRASAGSRPSNRVTHSNSATSKPEQSHQRRGLLLIRRNGFWMLILACSPGLALFSVLVLIVLLTALPAIHHTRYGRGQSPRTMRPARIPIYG